jgi:hypothetical protein
METGMRVVAGTNELQKVRVSLFEKKYFCRLLTPTSSSYHVRMQVSMQAGTIHLHERRSRSSQPTWPCKRRHEFDSLSLHPPSPPPPPSSFYVSVSLARTQAHRTQKKARRRMCCMLVSGTVAITLGA